MPTVPLHAAPRRTVPPTPSGNRHCGNKKKRASPAPEPTRLDDMGGAVGDRLRVAWGRTRVGLDKQIEAYRRFGRVWLKAKDEIARGNMDEEAYCAAHMPFGAKWANNCGKLAREYRDYLQADRWWIEEGRFLGIILNRTSGLDYALEITRRWRRWKSNKPQRPKAPSKDEARRGAIAELQNNLAAAERRAEQAEADKEVVVAELEDVVRRYQGTAEGFDYRSAVLEAARRGRPAVPRFDEWRTARGDGGQGDDAADIDWEHEPQQR